jgi:hypothetical protein
MAVPQALAPARRCRLKAVKAQQNSVLEAWPQLRCLGCQGRQRSPEAWPAAQMPLRPSRQTESPRHWPQS